MFKAVGEVDHRWAKVRRFGVHVWAEIAYLSGRSSGIRLSNSIKRALPMQNGK